MKEKRKKSARLALAFTVLAAVGSVVYATCWGGVRVHWDDGGYTDCARFCTFRGGWLCESA